MTARRGSRGRRSATTRRTTPIPSTGSDTPASRGSTDLVYTDLDALRDLVRSLPPADFSVLRG